jgi:hypothetical protein
MKAVAGRGGYVLRRLGPDSSDAEIQAIAAKHPAFEILPTDTPSKKAVQSIKDKVRAEKLIRRAQPAGRDVDGPAGQAEPGSHRPVPGRADE